MTKMLKVLHVQAKLTLQPFILADRETEAPQRE